MRTRQSTESVPSLHDQFSDAHAGHHGFADEPAPDEPRHEFTSEEEEQHYQWWLREVAERSAAESEPAYVVAVCTKCGTALLVQVGTRIEDVVCPRCQRETDAALEAMKGVA